MNNAKSNFLDANSSIMEKNLRFVKNDLEDELNNIFGAEPVKENKNLSFKIVKPTPGLCIKSFRSTDNEKVFINICLTEEIPAPEDITEEKLKEILISSIPSSYKIPMSISSPREIKDKNDQTITVCDIAINPIYFKKMESIQLFRDFLITIIFEALENKYQIDINLHTWLVLKNRKFMGNLIQHRIENRDVKKVYDSYNQKNPGENKKLIEIITSDKKEPVIFEKDVKINRISLPNAVNLDKTKIKSIKPDYHLVRSPPSGDVINHLIAAFHLPQCLSSSEIKLDVGEDRILLEARKRGYIFDGFVDYNIKQDETTAKFNITNCILTVTMPVC